MDILKAFDVFDEKNPINIIGTDDDPLFQADQVVTLLKFEEGIAILDELEDDCKKTLVSNEKTDSNETIFLTDKGLFSLLGWAGNEKYLYFISHMLKAIRLTGKYEVNQDTPYKSELDRIMLRLIGENDDESI